MKRIVLCCDGTWNSSDQKYPTNVVKLRDAVLPTAPDGTRQLVYYHNGVGTSGLLDKLPGGIFGSGLWRNVQLAYEHLVRYYEPGDELYLFGFSRGAYTARSVVGMMRKCGILRLSEIGRIAEAYDFYRDRTVGPDDKAARDFRSAHSVSLPAASGVVTAGDVPPVKFVGVWDTVGALGIPLGALGSIFNRKHRFHDVSLSRIVDNAYHALAIDETRKPFRPTLWEQHPAAVKQTLEQRWFAGVHTNIGGGNLDSRQSDRALLWMMSRAASCDLAFDEDYVRDKLQNAIDGTLTQSLFQRVARNVPFNLLTYVRPIGAGVPYNEANYLGGLSNEQVDPAVIDRNVADAAYMPPDLMAYYRVRPGALDAVQHASRSVWP